MDTQHAASWTDFLIIAYYIQWPLYGSFAKTLSDHHRAKQEANTEEKIARLKTQAIWKSAIANAAVAATVFALVYPLSEEMALSAGWQKIVLYIAGYMGFQALDVAQAIVRYRLSKFFGIDLAKEKGGASDVPSDSSK